MRDLIFSLTFEDYGPLIAKEIEELEERQAPIQKAILFVVAREECLKKLSSIIEDIRAWEELDNHEIIISLVDEASKVLVTLRYLTLDSVDAIIEWRNRLNYLIAKIPETGVDKHDFIFNYEHENYLLKIKDDTMFLKDSCLTKFIHFSSKSDPFLIIPSQVTPGSVAKSAKTKSK
jgi:hypothetical protein